MTLTQAFRAFIIADATLAAKVGAAVYPMTAPQSPPDFFAVTKVVSMPSFKKLDGATSQCSFRMEVTFWGRGYDDCEILALRLRAMVAPFNGVMGSGGVTLAVHQTSGPRGVYNPENRFMGAQLDILGVADLSTAS